mgnify:CR=1 FL=1
MVTATAMSGPFQTPVVKPLMPSARYNLSATVWPEDPICRSIGSQPESQMGREAASSAPRAWASASTTRSSTGTIPTS